MKRPILQNIHKYRW